MAATGEPYTVAARHVDQPAEPQPATTPARTALVVDGGPRLPDTWTQVHDVNPICGHHRRHNCLGCGTCTWCDGCYCREDDFHQPQWDGYGPSLEDEHANDRDGIHYGTYIDDCYACERERERSDNFTRCPDCEKPIAGGRREWKRHQPCAWRTTGGTKPDRRHPPGIDWTVLWGQRVTLNDRWLYHGDRAQYAGEWTGVIVPGQFAGDTYLPTLRLATDDGQVHDMSPMRHWTIEVHQDDGSRTLFEPTPGPRLLGHLTTVRVDQDNLVADQAIPGGPLLTSLPGGGQRNAHQAVHLTATDLDGRPIPGGPLLTSLPGDVRPAYRVLRTPQGWWIYLRGGWSQMPWVHSGDLQAVTGPDADWWQLTPGLEYRLQPTPDGRWTVHTLPETPCDLPDPHTRQDCRWPAYGTVTRTDGYTRAICSRQHHRDTVEAGQHDGPLPDDPHGPWT